MAATPRLIAACLKNDAEEVERIVLEDPQEILAKDDNGDTALHHCARSLESARCSEIIVQARPEATVDTNSHGQTPLHVAAAVDNADFVGRLLAVTKRPLSVKDAEQHTPVCVAISKGNADVCALLLEHSSNVQETDSGGASLLHLACRVSGTKGQEKAGLQIVNLLLRKGAAVHATDNEHRTPIMWAALMGNAKAVALLIDRGADVGSRDRHGKSTIHCAASLGHVAVMQLLLEHRPVQLVDMVDNNNCTPLLLAAGAGHEESVKLLLAREADPRRRDRNGRNAFHYAASGLHYNLFPALIEGGVDVWEKATNGETALHMICGHERCAHENCLKDGRNSLAELVRKVKTPADLDIVNNLGETALIKAAKGGRDDLCKILLKAGSDPTVEIDRDMLEPLTALDVATNEKCREIIERYMYLERNRQLEARENEEAEASENEEVEENEVDKEEKEAEENEVDKEEKEAEENEVDKEEKEAEENEVDKEEKETEENEVDKEEKEAEENEMDKEEKEAEENEVDKEEKEAEENEVDKEEKKKDLNVGNKKVWAKDEARDKNEDKDETDVRSEERPNDNEEDGKKETENETEAEQEEEEKQKTSNSSDSVRASAASSAIATEPADEKQREDEVETKEGRNEEIEGKNEEDNAEGNDNEEQALKTGEKEVEEEEGENEKQKELVDEAKESEDKDEEKSEGEEKVEKKEEEELKKEEKDETKTAGKSKKKRTKKGGSGSRTAKSTDQTRRHYPKGLLPPLRQISIDDYYERHPSKLWCPPPEKKKDEDRSDRSSKC